MAVWPFGRRPRRHSSVVVQEPVVASDPVPQSANQSASALPSRRMSKASSIQLPWRRNSVAKSADGKGPHTTTLRPIVPISPLDSEFDARPRTPDSQASAEHITALPQSRILKTSPHLRPAQRENADIPYDFRLQSSSSRLNTPTVPSHFHPSRKLSRSSGSKFGFSVRDSVPPKDVREEELRAMSTPAVTSRAPTRGGDTGILRRESKKVRSGLTLNLTRPESRISLPRPDTGIGSMMGQPDARSYRISIMDIMSPRPTIKSTEPYSMLTLGVTDSRAPSRRQMTANDSEFGRRSRRVNDLADNLDSTGLRVAMEREQRRKEKKKEADAERLRRRLERRAQMQHDDDSEPPLPSPSQTQAALMEAAAAVAVSRKRSRKRRKDESRRRSSSASRPDTGRRRKPTEDQPTPPLPVKPDMPSEVTGPAATQPCWPKRTDSRQPRVASPQPVTLDAHPKANLSPTKPTKEERPNTPLSRRLNVEDPIITPDRIVPEEDPDDAEPPSIARHRHPKHEMPHVAHLYAQQQGSHSTAPVAQQQQQQPATRAAGPQDHLLRSPTAEAASPTEPVLDLMSVEPPEIFAPADTEGLKAEALSFEEQDSQRVSPLLPNDGEDIPGLPFLSSLGSDTDSPIVSPFAASFPTSFPETDFAAPGPTVHRDPLLMREARLSSLSRTSPDHPYGSSSSITALPQVPVKAETPADKPKRKRGPSMILSFFRRGDKRHGRGRSSSEAAAEKHVGVQHELIAKKFEESLYEDTYQSPTPHSPPKPSLGTLVRSHSRFKEDLSGLNVRGLNKVRPPSPPESRINSPYHQVTPGSADYMRGAIITPVSHPRYSTQSTYAMPRDDERRRSKSMNRMSNPLSKSMASIDSEGSWLTGKPVRGSSTRSNQLRNLASDLHRAPSDAYSRRNVHPGAYSSTSEENLEKISALDHFGLQPGRTLNSRHGAESQFHGASEEDPTFNSSHMASSEVMVRSTTPTGAGDAGLSVRLSTDIYAKFPEIKPGIRVKSSEGMLRDFLPTAIDVDVHLQQHKDLYIEESTSEESLSAEKKEAEVFRVVSTRTSPRVVSIGSAAKLLELSSDARSANEQHNITQ